jgi:simple sugar transport system permease protein
MLQFHGQGLGPDVPSEFLSMLPYPAAIVALVTIRRHPQTILLNKPMSLGAGLQGGPGQATLSGYSNYPS